MAHLTNKRNDLPTKKRKRKGKKKINKEKLQKKKKDNKKKELLPKLPKPESIFEVKKLHLDSRVYIQFSEWNQKCMDGFFATKKKKQRIAVNTYLRAPKNQLQTHDTIRYMDVAYLILEMYEGTNFPDLDRIKDPFKKYKQAIVRVGSEQDDMKEEIQKRDLETVLKDLPESDRPVVCYRIRKRVYERLMHHLMWESVPVFTYGKPIPIRPSSILFPLRASNNGNKNFFHYLIGGHLMLKNGDCYKLSSLDQGFEGVVSDYVNLVESSEVEE